MVPWRKETLGLQVGDFIIWRDEAVEAEGRPALVAPGMKGKVLSLHDGFHLDSLILPDDEVADLQAEGFLSPGDHA